MEINGIRGFINPLVAEEEGRQDTEGRNFAKTLEEFIQWVNQQQEKSKEIKGAVLSGEDVPLHRMVVEFQKAGIALNLLIEIRNRLLEGFQELMRMQV